jgi:hypothetical protein
VIFCVEVLFLVENHVIPVIHLHRAEHRVEGVAVVEGKFGESVWGMDQVEEFLLLFGL